MLVRIEERNITSWEKEHFDWITEILKEINEHGTFNCIFSDGKFLICHTDKGGYNELHFVERTPPYDKKIIRLSDEDWEVDLSDEKNLMRQVMLSQLECLPMNVGKVLKLASLSCLKTVKKFIQIMNDFINLSTMSLSNVTSFYQYRLIPRFLLGDRNNTGTPTPGTRVPLFLALV